MLASSSLEIVDRGMRAEVFEQLEAARAAGQPRHPAAGVGQVAEDHRLGRTGLGAGRLHLAVTNLPFFYLGLFLGAADALDAEAALLHHPPAAHGNVRRKLVVQRFGPLVRIKVEDPHRVGAVVAAIARTDATVIDLAVQAVRVVVAGVDRADRLAGGVVAVLAHNRQEAYPDVGILTHPEALDTQPVHVAPLGDLLFFADSHVVLGLAGHHAGTATGAAVQVDHHPPFV